MIPAKTNYSMQQIGSSNGIIKSAMCSKSPCVRNSVTLNMPFDKHVLHRFVFLKVGNAIQTTVPSITIAFVQAATLEGSLLEQAVAPAQQQAMILVHGVQHAHVGRKRTAAIVARFRVVRGWKSTPSPTSQRRLQAIAVDGKGHVHVGGEPPPHSSCCMDRCLAVGRWNHGRGRQ